MRGDRLALHYLYGLLMGGADIVPGVSGGTVALVLGIYTRLIDSIGRAVASIPHLARGRPGPAARSVLSVEWTLVAPLGAGILSAIAVGSAVIPELIEDHPVLMRATFFGLIAASLTLPWRRIRSHSTSHFMVLGVAAACAFLFAGLPDTAVAQPSHLLVFTAAAVAICAMILPGVSGAFLLLVVGMYEPTLEAVHDRDVAYVAVFMLGAAVGLALFSSVLRWLLVRAHDVTMAALVGLMLGSLRALWPYLNDDRSLRMPAAEEPILLAVLVAIAACVLVLVLSGFSDHRERARSS